MRKILLTGLLSTAIIVNQNFAETEMADSFADLTHAKAQTNQKTTAEEEVDSALRKAFAATEQGEGIRWFHQAIDSSNSKSAKALYFSAKNYMELCTKTDSAETEQSSGGRPSIYKEEFRNLAKAQLEKSAALIDKYLDTYPSNPEWAEHAKKMLEKEFSNVSTGTGSLKNINVNAINSKNPKIHSWVAMDIESGDTVGTTNQNTQPRSVASTIKLAVINAALREVKEGRMSLDEVLTVKGPNDQSYDGEKIGTKFTVAQAIYATLIRSSNTCPNLLAIRMGKLSGTNRKLQEMGYKNTIYNYLSSIKRTESVKPGSTAFDMAKVARDFYKTWRNVQGTGSGSAWAGFSKAKDMIKAEGHKTLGGKIGSNSLSATNTGLFEVNGRVYAIVVFSEANGLANNYAADAYLNKASTDIANAIAGK